MSHAHEGCFFPLNKKYSNKVKYYSKLKELLIFYNAIYSCDGKAEFSAAITPVFSVTLSFSNHSNHSNNHSQKKKK